MTNPTNLKLDQFYSNCEYIKQFCENANEQLSKNCNELADSAKLINKIAHEFMPFESIPCNGFFIFLRVLNAYFDLIVMQIKTKNKIDPKLIKLFELIFLYRDWLMETYGELNNEIQNDLKSSNIESTRLSLKNGQFFRSKNAYKIVHMDNEITSLIHSKYIVFYLKSEKNRSLLKFLCFLVASTNKLPFSLSSLVSVNSFGKNCSNSFRFANLNNPFNLWHVSEKYGIAKLVNSYFNKKIPVKSVTLKIPKQKRFRLDCKGNILDLYTMTKEEIDELNNDEEEQSRQNSPGRRHRNHEKIQCRYSFIKSKQKIIESLERIKLKKENLFEPNRAGHYSAHVLPDDHVNNNLNNNENSSENDILMLHIHAGGFFIQGAKSSEIYLRKIVDQLGGIPILSIDYSLTVPYPVPWQEILDAYLWLLSGEDEVKEQLGFHPKRIVVTGDSCGGHFCVTLAIFLNELNKLINKSESNGHINELVPNRSIPLPKAIIAAYPLFLVSKITPSKCLLSFETFVQIHLYLIVTSFVATNLSTNGDFKKIESSEKFQKIVAKNYDENEDQTNESSDDSSAWFNCDYATFKNRVDYINSFINHPFIDPSLYGDKYEELKGIDLYTFVGNDDTLLDDTLELMRLWKGKKRLDVFDDVIHGFLNFYPFSVPLKDAFETVISRYQEACDLI